MLPTFADCMREVDAGRVACRTSLCGNYVVFDYLPIVHSDWNETVLWCRGLVFDRHKQTRVNLPLKKFFNLGQIAETQSEVLKDKTIRAVYEKADGSLGLCWWDNYQDKPVIHTRGAFASDQAIWATQWLTKHLTVHLEARLRAGYTYLFEILYPDNRVVCNYNGWEGLVCLGSQILQDGEIRFEDADLAASVGFRDVVPYTIQSLQDLVQEVEGWSADREGVVVLFEDGTRCKIKSAEYLKVHRLRFGMNHNRIYDCLKEGVSPIEFLLQHGMPDEFIEEVRVVEQEARDRIKALRDESMAQVHQCTTLLPGASRKEQSLWAQENLDRKSLRRFFIALDGREDDLFVACLRQIEIPKVNRINGDD